MKSCPTFSSSESELRVLWAQSPATAWGTGLAEDWSLGEPESDALARSKSARVNPIRSGCTVTAYVEIRNRGSCIQTVDNQKYMFMWEVPEGHPLGCLGSEAPWGIADTFRGTVKIFGETN
jgi:hypothetical protein